jgi:hypothetical protein
MRPEIVFLLEEPSAKAMLETLLPRILDPQLHHRLIPFEGKQDLENSWSESCADISTLPRVFSSCATKTAMQIAKHSRRLCWRSAAAGKGDVSLVRIACRELESFYLADLEAVESAFCLAGLRKFQGTAKYRDPDRLGSPSKELHELTGGKYQKVGDQEPLDRIWIWKTHGPTVFQI